MKPWYAAGLLLVVLTSSAPASGGERPPNARTLANIAALATGKSLSEKDAGAVAARIAEGSLTRAQWVDSLLADRGFAETIVPQVIFGIFLGESPKSYTGFTLSQLQTSRGTLFYLRKPCKASRAERVHPWWAMESEVLVCPDSHRPDRLFEPTTKSYCGGRNLGGRKLNENDATEKRLIEYCGCGPNLIHCTRDTAQQLAMLRSMQREVLDTTISIIERDLPLSTLFTTNETVRDRNVEFLYQRWRVASGELRSISPMPELDDRPRLAPRVEQKPGQHAGLLTTQQWALNFDSPRGRTRDFTMLLWCSEPESTGATTEQVLSLGATSLREGEGWEKLAAMPVCTNCHARMDYAMQFFTGFPSLYRSNTYVASEQRDGMGPVYVRDIRDLRGTIPLTPHAFATLAVQQPEYEQCVVRRISDHVLPGVAGPAEKQALRDAFHRRGSVKDLMREALVRYWDRLESPRAPTPMESTANAILEARCRSCHEFAGYDKLSREEKSKMLSAVAFGRMPKTFAGLGIEERRRFARLLIDDLWKDDATRAKARSHFEQAAPPVLPGFILSERIHATAKSPHAADWPVIEARFSPATAAALAVEATAACREVKAESLERCVDHVLQIDATP